MNIFLSYSSSEGKLAERLAYRLRGDGHTVFFDRSSLPPGEAYDTRIREAIKDSDLLVFLLSEWSVSTGSYALTELGIAQHEWQNPSGRVLPVMVSEVDIEALPPYLSSVTVMRPKGELIADVAAEVSRIGGRRIMPRVYAALALTGLILVATATWYWWPAAGVSGAPGGRQVVTAEPVKIVGSLGNTGWTLNFDIISEQPPTEIFYRFAEDDNYKSTGFSQHRDSRTGRPAPRQHIEAGHLQGRQTLLVKFSDASGMEHGPYRVVFDVPEQVVAWAKQVLGQTENAWLAFREYPENERMLLYFTHLISYKNGLREIRYSVDDESLSRRVKYTPAMAGGSPGRINDDDQTYIEIPMTAKFVAVQLVFVDGSEWPLKRFAVKPNL